MSSLRKILDILNHHERRHFYVLITQSFLMALIDVTSVVSILPFLAVVSNPEIISENFYLNSLYNMLHFESTQNFLVLLGSCVFFLLLSRLHFGPIISTRLLDFQS